MVSKYFQINNPFLQGFFPLVLGVLWWSLEWTSFSGEVIGNKWFELIRTENHFVNNALGFVLVNWAAIKFNRLLDTAGIVTQFRFLPGLVLLFFFSLDQQVMGLTPLVLGLVPLMYAIQVILKLNNKGEIHRFVFLAGLFLGLAGLLYPPFFLLVFTFPVIITLIRGWAFRYFFWNLFGVLFPLYMVGGIEFSLTGELNFLKGVFISPRIITVELAPAFGLEMWKMYALLSVVILTSVIGVVAFLRIRQLAVLKIQQRMAAVLILFIPFYLLFAAGYFMGQGYQLALLALPVGYLLNYWISYQSNPILRDVAFLLFFGTLITIAL